MGVSSAEAGAFKRREDSTQSIVTCLRKLSTLKMNVCTNINTVGSTKKQTAYEHSEMVHNRRAIDTLLSLPSPSIQRRTIVQ